MIEVSWPMVAVGVLSLLGFFWLIERSIARRIDNHLSAVGVQVSRILALADAADSQYRAAHAAIETVGVQVKVLDERVSDLEGNVALLQSHTGLKPKRGG